MSVLFHVSRTGTEAEAANGGDSSWSLCDGTDSLFSVYADRLDNPVNTGKLITKKPNLHNLQYKLHTSRSSTTHFK